MISSFGLKEDTLLAKPGLLGSLLRKNKIKGKGEIYWIIKDPALKLVTCNNSQPEYLRIRTHSLFTHHSSSKQQHTAKQHVATLDTWPVTSFSIYWSVTSFSIYIADAACSRIQSKHLTTPLSYK